MCLFHLFYIVEPTVLMVPMQCSLQHLSLCCSPPCPSRGEQRGRGRGAVLRPRVGPRVVREEAAGSDQAQREGRGEDGRPRGRGEYQGYRHL